VRRLGPPETLEELLERVNTTPPAGPPPEPLPQVPGHTTCPDPPSGESPTDRAPLSLDPLSVGPIGGHELLPVVHHLVGETKESEPPVGPPPIGVDLAPSRDPLAREAKKRGPLPVPDDGQAHLAIIRYNTQDPYLGVDTAAPIFAAAVDEGLVHLDDSPGTPHLGLGVGGPPD